LRDDTFSSFDRTTTCNGQTNGQTNKHGAIAYTALAWHLVVITVYRSSSSANVNRLQPSEVNYDAQDICWPCARLGRSTTSATEQKKWSRFFSTGYPVYLPLTAHR